MKFTLSWLKEYLETKASLEEICDKLTSIGLEVESLEDKSKILAPFSVAKIIDAQPHENSNKLKICQVQTSSSETPLQIICGAKNARLGLKVAYAPIGSIIPTNQMVIKKAKIAGIESSGMLCSARELGIGIEDEGIIEVAEKWEVGTKITEVFGLNDAIIEINVTPNRGDCLGIFGIARDLSATGIGTLKNLNLEKISGNFPLAIEVKNEASDICNYAVFRHLKNVKNCESPQWLKEKLTALGVNSISAIVDITNYVMLTLNRPMHAYDASKIDGSIKIRFAENGEKFTSLKNDEFTLDSKMLVIADDKKPLGLAGIIGSSNSSCDSETSEILLEAAFFKPSTIAYAGRKLNILSDARFRFERGVDEANCESGIDLATKLIIEICGGEASEVKIIGKKSTINELEFDLTKITKLIGIKIPEETIFKILSDLSFGIEKTAPEKLLVKIPSHRHDISIAADLVEEIVRIFGYSAIPKTELLKINDEPKNLNILHQVRSELANSGMIETISWSFVDENLVEIFAEKNPKLILKNPISIELNHMRPTLAIGLLESYRKNVARNFSDLSLFEIGNVFSDKQKLIIAGLRSGKNKEQSHFHDEREFDVFDVKKDLLNIVEFFGLRPESLQFSTDDLPKYYHPHRSATLKLGKNLVGHFGEIHPAIAKKFDLKNRVNFFEIFVESLPQNKKPNNHKPYKAIDLQLVERDFAFLVERDQAVGDIIKTITNCDKQLISNVTIFDIFSGKNIAENKKSVALRVKIQPIEKTLTSEEIDAISQKIVESITKSFAATLRE
jgi:phenylalanyl-tRNA synthetase beta chain